MQLLGARKYLVAGVLCAFVLAGCSSNSKTSSSTTTTATTAPASTTTTAPPTLGATATGRLLGQALTNAEHMNWVHAHVTTTDQGMTATIEQDAGLTSGKQVVTLGAASATTEFLSPVVFFRGNVGAVTDFFGVTGTQASALANHWVSIQTTDPAYQAASSDTTIVDILKELVLVAPLTKTAPTTIDGQKVIGISGKVQSTTAGSGTGTVYLTTTGKLLPVAFHASTNAGTIDVTFSKWGQAVALTNPTNAIPFASLGFTSGSPTSGSPTSGTPAPGTSTP